MESSTNSVSDRLPLLRSEVKDISRKVSGLEGQRTMLQATHVRLVSETSDLTERIQDLKLIETYLAAFADERQAQVYKQIETTVTEGLRAVFGEDLRLEVANKMVGARAETVFSLVSPTPDGDLRTAIMDARGGGVAAIVGFLIQAVLVLLTPGLRPIVFLDESFRNVSEDYQAPLGEFIKDLCERTGLQVILVTHQPTIAEYADQWYSFSQHDGKTQIKKVV